jgi:hypothetical protein
MLPNDSLTCSGLHIWHHCETITVVREQFNAPDHSKHKYDKALKVVKSFKRSM